MNVLDQLLQIVAVEISAGYLSILQRIAEEPDVLFQELGREKSSILLKDIYDLCDGNEKSQQYLLSTDFAKLISGERKLIKAKIILDKPEDPKDPDAIAEKFREDSKRAVTNLKEELNEILEKTDRGGQH